MNVTLVSQIRKFVMSRSQIPSCAPASHEITTAAESQLGFSMPPLLKDCYESISNGDFGPGYGFIGVDGGASSAFGTLVETHNQLKSDQESLGNAWKDGLLPFCDWGCNIFSCVDCNDPKFPVYTFDAGNIHLQSYSLEDFLKMWLEGVDILSSSTDCK